jgi:hypothetical protein
MRFANLASTLSLVAVVRFVGTVLLILGAMCIPVGSVACTGVSSRGAVADAHRGSGGPSSDPRWSQLGRRTEIGGLETVVKPYFGWKGPRPFFYWFWNAPGSPS